MMEASFWHERWEAGEIPFHECEVNAFLMAHVARLELAPGSRVFVPLCGKTRDMHWLMAQGYRVVGAELSELAVRELFEELGIEPSICREGELLCYRSDSIDVWVGDIFLLSQTLLGEVDAVYDRGALVALPDDIRPRYAAHLLAMTADAPQLLITYQYDQHLMAGPPFSLGETILNEYYGQSHQVHCIDSQPVAGGLRELEVIEETAWLIRPLQTKPLQTK